MCHSAREKEGSSSDEILSSLQTDRDCAYTYHYFLVHMYNERFFIDVRRDDRAQKGHYSMVKKRKALVRRTPFVLVDAWCISSSSSLCEKEELGEENRFDGRTAKSIHHRSGKMSEKFR